MNSGLNRLLVCRTTLLSKFVTCTNYPPIMNVWYKLRLNSVVVPYISSVLSLSPVSWRYVWGINVLENWDDNISCSNHQETCYNLKLLVLFFQFVRHYGLMIILVAIYVCKVMIIYYIYYICIFIINMLLKENIIY